MEDLNARPMPGLRTRARLLLPTLLLAALMATPALAQDAAVASTCTIDAVDVFPASGSRVPTNARFVLEGFGPRAGQLRRLIGKQLILSAGSQKVSLTVKSAFSAGDERIAVELVTRGPLEPNTTYTLDLGQVLPLVKFRGGGDASVLTWSTGRGIDRASPVLKSIPSVIQGQVSKAGERQVVFRVDATEDGPVLLVGKLRQARGGPTRRYFIPVRGGRADLGDEACGGLRLEKGRAYRVKFQVVDVAGQTSTEVEEIEFNAPRSGNE